MHVFDEYAEEYDRWFDEHATLYRSELRALEQAVPTNQIGLAIGVGTGRFAGPLTIPYGVEPADNMAKMAEKRGISVFLGYAEDLPFPDASFDFALMVTTVCFLTDSQHAFAEACRILQPQGTIIIGLIEKNSELGHSIANQKGEDKFYKHARLHSTEEVTEALATAGFHSFAYWQTLTDLQSEQIEQPQRGYGDGSFVVIQATK